MPKHSADPSQHAALTVALATGQTREDPNPIGPARRGHALAASLTPERRSEIAKKAAAARWKD